MMHSTRPTHQGHDIVGKVTSEVGGHEACQPTHGRAGVVHALAVEVLHTKYDMYQSQRAKRKLFKRCKYTSLTFILPATGNRRAGKTYQ